MRRAPRAAPHDNIVIVGRSRPAAHLARWTRERGAAARRVDTSQEGVDAIGPQTQGAFLLALTTSKEPLRAAVERLLRRLGDKPLLLIHDGQLSRRRASVLYALGAAVLLLWPEDRPLIRRLLAKLLSRDARPDAVDRRLAAAINKRLHRHPDTEDSALLVHVIDRVAFVAGEVDWLWKRSLIEKTIGHVEGVEEVVTHDLVVAPTACSDAAVKSAAKRLLDGVMAGQAKTVAVTVDDGVVTLAGTLDRRHDLRRFVGLLANIYGVREIKNLVTLSAEETASARTIARRASTALSSYLPNVRARPIAFGDVLVLEGEADFAYDRDLASELCARLDGVRRVVNKIHLVHRAA